jgi:YjbE family integral membrane protein
MHADIRWESLHSPGQFLSAVLSIVLIDIVLAGDNAVVIAMVVRTLPPPKRLWGTLLGAGMAVLLRVALTAVAAQLMNVNYIRLIGGLLILWIAVKLLLQEEPDQSGDRTAGTLWQAVWLIMVADISMSLDNVLAVAGASKGHIGLLLFGLGLSIPLVVFTSNLLARLMDRYPIIVYIGAAILGKVGGEMMMTDRLTTAFLAPPDWLIMVIEAVFAAGVIIFALFIRRRRSLAACRTSSSTLLK